MSGRAARILRGMVAAYVVAGISVALAQQTAPAPSRPDAVLSPQFKQNLLDSIDRTLNSNEPAPSPTPPGSAASSPAPNAAPAPAVEVGLSPDVASAMRVGMTGIRPVSKFPAACMPIMGVPNTGINPLLANASSGSVHIAVLAELSGNDAPIGRNWRDGIALAAKIINQSGGLLGRPVELKSFDVANASQDRAAAAAALDDNPFVVLGPVTSGAAYDTMDVLRRVQIPQLVGTRGLTDTPNDNPYLFRTGTTAIEEVVEIGTYLRDQRRAHRIVIVS
jgi:ABC-type branched-subunit amino acid transport system substrate-binding protein